MGKSFFRIFISAAFLLAGTETLMAGKAAKRFAEQQRRACVMQNKAFNGQACFDCAPNQELDQNLAICRQAAIKCAEGQRVSNGSCVSACPAGQIWQAGKCVLEKCPDGYVKKGNECLKDSGPTASGNATGSQCGQVNVGGRWQTVKCPAGQKCENPTGRTGTCVAGSAAAPVGTDRTESKENGLCGKVKAANGAIDNVTCTSGMTCTLSTNATYAAQGLGSCKKPAAAAPAGGTEGVGQRCGTWYSGGDVTKSCAAGLTCMNNSLTAPIAAGKSGTCARPCSDPNGVNGCSGGWSARP